MTPELPVTLQPLVGRSDHTTAGGVIVWTSGECEVLYGDDPRAVSVEQWSVRSRGPRTLMSELLANSIRRGSIGAEAFITSCERMGCDSPEDAHRARRASVNVARGQSRERILLRVR